MPGLADDWRDVLGPHFDTTPAEAGRRVGDVIGATFYLIDALERRQLEGTLRGETADALEHVRRVVDAALIGRRTPGG